MGEKINSLEDLFIMELKDMYNAEKQITKALPKMIEAASHKELKDKFKRHLEVTQKQISRLEEVFDMLDMEPEEEHCEGMAGIIKDGELIVSAQGNPKAKDAGLIAAAQKVEHYEISSYGTLRTFAHTLGYDDVAEKLQKTLDEESKSDKMLSKVAESSVNPSAT